MSELPDKPWIPITEAAQLLGVSRMTIYRWIQKGDVESIGALYFLKVSRESLLQKVGKE
jgi:predicted site-specific integrase-resolvase